MNSIEDAIRDLIDVLKEKYGMNEEEEQEEEEEDNSIPTVD